MRAYISGVGAGAAISLGGMAYITAENQIFGAIVFTVGLYAVLMFGLRLYTGEIAYILQRRDPKIILALAGNLTGACGMGRLFKLSGLAARDAVSARIARTLTESLILGFLCGACIFIGVEAYKRSQRLITGLSVIAFVAAGFEHSIADAFYFTVAGWTWREAACLAAVIIGNAAGGIAAYCLTRFAEGEKIL